jgi:hypothetical protein
MEPPRFQVADLEENSVEEQELLSKLPPRMLSLSDSSEPFINKPIKHSETGSSGSVANLPRDKQDRSDIIANENIVKSQSLSSSKSIRFEEEQAEKMLKSQISQYEDREEKLRHQLLNHTSTFEQLMIEKENHWKLLLEEKDKHIAELIQRVNLDHAETKRKLQEKDAYYIDLIKQMESKHVEDLKQIDNQWKNRVKVLEDEINRDQERRTMIEKAKINTKEASLQKKFDKKLTKYTQKIEQVIDYYKTKELTILGALEEARREIVHLQAVHIAQEQSSRNEIVLKNKRLVEIQHRLDEIDEIHRREKYWKDSAKDLASLVIHACATVEELPRELWNSTTPGLFTSVWDEMRGRQAGYGMASLDQSNHSYAEKKKHCVVASRSALAKCLKYSKVCIYTLSLILMILFDIFIYFNLITVLLTLLRNMV